MYRISQLAEQFGLSRSTLLYYDRIGLLSPSARSEAGYRQYSSADRERLESICSLRRAGAQSVSTGQSIRNRLDTESGLNWTVFSQLSSCRLVDGEVSSSPAL